MNKLFLVLLLLANSAFAVTANKVWRIPSGATLPAWGPVNLADGTNAITGQLASKANLPALGIQKSSSSGSFTSSSACTTFADVTNLSISVTTTGRPVQISFQGTGGDSYFAVTSSSTTNIVARYIVVRGSTEISRAAVAIVGATNGAQLLGSTAPGSMNVIDDTVTAGTYTYKVQTCVVGAGVSASVPNVIMLGYEL